MTRTIGDKVAEHYQERIVGEVARTVAERRSGVVVAPTGSGKSVMIGMVAEDCHALGLPVMVLHPNVGLLRQNLAQIRDSSVLGTQPVGLFAAKNERLGSAGGMRAGQIVTGGVTLATNMSLTNKQDEPWFLEQLERFGREGGVILVDEGHRAAADELGRMLSKAAAAGAIAIIVTATPNRTDGRDPLEPFGASMEGGIVGVAEHDEVLATGRTVPTVFELANEELRERIGAEAAAHLEDVFEELVAQGRSIDQASGETFGRLFRPEATEAERRIAEVLTTCIVDVWWARASGRRLAMVHCDSVAMARALASEAAGRPMPPNHPRGGQRAIVGYVDAGSVTMWRGGAEVGLDELGWRKGEARERLLEEARAGAFDVVFNITALGTGTDVPITDLTIIACYRKSPGPLKQSAGRAERSFNGKANQLLVDVGESVSETYAQVLAADAGDAWSAGAAVRAMDPRVRRQFRQWFDGDPGLAARVEAARSRSRPGPVREEGEDRGDPVSGKAASLPTASLPRAREVCAGVWAVGSRAWARTGEGFEGKVALAFDLGALGVLADGANLPGWATVVRGSDGAAATHLGPDLETARRFAAGAGVVARRARAAVPPTDAQRKRWAWLSGEVRALLSGRLRDLAAPRTKEDAAAVIDGLGDLPAALDRLVAAVGNRALRNRNLDHPLAAIVVDAPARVAPGRVAAISTYVGLCALVRPAARRPALAAFGSRARAELAAAFGVPQAEVDDAGSTVDDPGRRERLARMCLAGRVGECTGRVEAPEDWLRRRLGLRGATEAGRRREDLVIQVLATFGRLEVPGHGDRFARLDVDAAEASAVLMSREGWTDRALSPAGRALAALGEAVVAVPAGTAPGALAATLREAPRGQAALVEVARGATACLDRHAARASILADAPSDQERVTGVLREWVDARRFAKAPPPRRVEVPARPTSAPGVGRGLRPAFPDAGPEDLEDLVLD